MTQTAWNLEERVGESAALTPHLTAPADHVRCLVARILAGPANHPERFAAAA